MINFLGDLSEAQSADFKHHYINYVVILLQRPVQFGLGPLLAGKVDVLNLDITHNLSKTDCVRGDFVSVLKLRRKHQRESLRRAYVPANPHYIRSEH